MPGGINIILIILPTYLAGQLCGLAHTRHQNAIAEALYALSQGKMQLHAASLKQLLCFMVTHQLYLDPSH